METHTILLRLLVRQKVGTPYIHTFCRATLTREIVKLTLFLEMISWIKSIPEAQKTALHSFFPIT